MPLEDKQWVWANLAEITNLALNGDAWADSLIDALLNDLLAP